MKRYMSANPYRRRTNFATASGRASGEASDAPDGYDNNID
jgi:hypothetical protein